ncbi:MAG: hypothetical protein J6J17_05385 [Bacilli bacterium]|nr:hypothetical protein [Bacilli bacterium]
MLNEYPYDVGVNLYYADILYLEGNFELALEICKNYLSNNAIKYKYAKINKQLGNNEEAKKTFFELYKDNGNVTAYINIINILVKESNYKLAYDYLVKLDSTIILSKKNEDRLAILRRYIYPELVDIFKEDDNLEYYLKQIVEYDESSAREYIKNFSKTNKNYVFNSNIDLDDLFNKAKKIIENEDCTCYDLFDKYIVHVPFESKAKNINTNYITIITNLNTKDIVCIYPSENYNKNVIQYNIEQKDNKLTLEYKRESQIDKFNKRYNKK